jgi:hypothetical protein
VPIGPNDVYEQTYPANVLPDNSGVFENTVQVSANAVGSAEVCTASDSVKVKRIEPVIPVSCSDIKDLTALTMVWNGPSGVTVTTAAGEVFENVQNGNQITFQASKAVMGNDFAITLSGAVNGQSEFHLSCSDDDMDGSDDCGKDQGNGKGDDSSLINDWLLDGMIGEKGDFACGLPNTGVVDPTPGGPGPGDNVVLTKTEVKDMNLKLELENLSNQDLFITRVYVEWPLDADELEKMKLAGDFAKDIKSKDGTTDVPSDKAFESDDNKRKLKKGDKDKLEIEFKMDLEKEGLDVGDFKVIVEFDDGSVVTLN